MVSLLRLMAQGPRFHDMQMDGWLGWNSTISDAVMRAIDSAIPVHHVVPAGGRVSQMALDALMVGADRNRAVEVQQLGALGEKFVAVSAEPALGLRELCPANSLLVGYSRDVFGYWPLEMQIGQGGYEVNGLRNGSAFRTRGGPASIRCFPISSRRLIIPRDRRVAATRRYSQPIVQIRRSASMDIPQSHDQNADQVAYWNGPAGQRWAERQAAQDVLLKPVADLVDRSGAAEAGRAGHRCRVRQRRHGHRVRARGRAVRPCARRRHIRPDVGAGAAGRAEGPFDRFRAGGRYRLSVRACGLRCAGLAVRRDVLRRSCTVVCQ